MSENLQKHLLLWIARTVSILFALFLAMFALDVFREGTGFWKAMTAFIIHLLPALLVVFFLILGWKKPWLSGISFVLLSIFFFYFYRGNSTVNSIIIVGPLVVNAVLFLIVYFTHGDKPAEQSKPAEPVSTDEDPPHTEATGDPRP